MLGDRLLVPKRRQAPIAGGVGVGYFMDSGKMAVGDRGGGEQKEPIVMTRGVDGLAWLPLKSRERDAATTAGERQR